MGLVDCAEYYDSVVRNMVVLHDIGATVSDTNTKPSHLRMRPERRLADR